MSIRKILHIPRHNLFPLALPDEGIYITEEESYEEDLNGDGFNEEIKFVYSKTYPAYQKHGMNTDNISSGDCWLEILDGTNKNVCRLKLAEEHYLKNYITPDIIFFDVNLWNKRFNNRQHKEFYAGMVKLGKQQRAVCRIQI